MPSEPAEAGPSPDPAWNDRLQRVEEAVAFTEHTVEQLSAETNELNRRVRALLERIESLERRVSGVVEQIEKQADEDGDAEA